MQTLQSFTHSLKERANLQKLRDNLQELPKRLLSRLDQPDDCHLGSVHGEYNYHFTFRLEGGGFFQTGVLVASAERAPGGLPVPLKCRWKRRVGPVGDLPVEIPGVTSNMYQISADDVGTDICVEARPADADDGLFGVAVGEIGPFTLDPATRRSLDNALGSDDGRFVVAQSRGPGDLAIHVTAEAVRVAPALGAQAAQGGGGREVVAEYSADYPKVLIHPLDTTKFQLEMSELKTFHLSALSRTARDIIALTIRCFHAKRYLATANILRVLLPVQPLAVGVGGPPAGPPDGRLDACILLERLTKELNRSMQQKEVSERALRNTNNEKKELQAQLIETISGFTEVIEGLQDQFADGGSSVQHGVPPAMPVERLQDQLREVSAQNQALQAELQAVRHQAEGLQAARRAREADESGQGGPAHEARRLLEERGLLQARLAELGSRSSSSVQQQDCADQAHTQELKRLRQDVEGLHNRKEYLRRDLQDKDREREDLQQNFLYVKSQLDKVQMRQAQAAANGAGDGSMEFKKHQRTLDMAGEERSKLSMRLEAALNDAEKGKAYHEQSLERVMNLNARLMEEKDRASREVQRLSQLYAESVNQLQNPLSQTLNSGVFRTDSSTTSEGADHQEDVARARAELARLEEALGRREQENESLKNRIRKLAVA